MSKNKSILTVKNLSKSYGNFKAVDNVSFTIASGEVFALLGPNGAGKTSIISCISGVQNFEQGSIAIDGADIVTSVKDAKFNMGVVPQELINHGFFNVQQILEFYSGFYAIGKNKDRIHFLLDRLGLWEHKDKRVRTLSGGMKRRVLIAKALLHKPKLLLLDEPTAGIDIELRKQLWSFVKELKAEGMAILLTTHYLEEAEQLSDRLGVLRQGKLECLSDSKSLITKLGTKIICIELEKPMETKHPLLLKVEGRKLHFHLPMNYSLGALFKENNIETKDVADIHIEKSNLESVVEGFLQSEITAEV
ncbi:MAG: ABC transporter ATP-binding protein [Bdellovibrionaceae bacterium]|nr:ABC transporter ATP-binding protein [Pseudobdellovibrionaceae bacterium]